MSEGVWVTLSRMVQLDQLGIVLYNKETEELD